MFMMSLDMHIFMNYILHLIGFVILHNTFEISDKFDYLKTIQQDNT
jgi:hypothetical protein